MKIKQDKEPATFGPGVSIELTGDDLVLAIEAWLVAKGVHVRGARTITVNGELCESGLVYVDPSGFVMAKGKRYPQ